MNIQTPAQVAANRTARLVREAHTPTYSTATPSEASVAEVREQIIRKAQDVACGEDFCHICSRATDHWGEHSDEQIWAFAQTAKYRFLVGA